MRDKEPCNLIVRELFNEARGREICQRVTVYFEIRWTDRYIYTTAVYVIDRCLGGVREPERVRSFLVHGAIFEPKRGNRRTYRSFERVWNLFRVSIGRVSI